jgi:membrane fusion protein, copper/silver efflux system
MKRAYLTVISLLLIASFFAGYLYSQRNMRTTEGAGNRKVLYYVDPMNPGVKSDKPGLAPCGMPLEPVYTADAGSKEGSSLPPGTVKINPDRQQLIGVKVTMVEKAPWSHTIRVLGRVVPDENRIYRINAATDGWVKQILPVTTDSLVGKNELLATFYAPEFFSAMKAYLYGLRSLNRFETSGKETKEQLDLTDANIENYRNALRNLGMTEHQLDEIMRTRQGGDQVEIRAPAAGFILARNLSLGQRFERGTELYRIADLSRVWIVADTFETEAFSFAPGMQVRVSAHNLKKTFFALVANVPPRFDSASRTLQVRLEADNPGLTLRPDMFVDVELPMSLPDVITVPVDALIDTGLKKTVYVDLGGGYFEPRRVETGMRLGKQVEITGGLMPGEKVVVSGNFLMDSESRMRAVAAGIHSEQSKDPVCGMFVEEEKARAAGKTSRYEGQIYFFCCDQCKEEFEKDPKKYTVTKDIQGTTGDQPAASASHHMEMKEGAPLSAAQDELAMPTQTTDMQGMEKKLDSPVASESPTMPAHKHD